MKKIKAKELKPFDIIMIKDVHYTVLEMYQPYNKKQIIFTDDGLERQFPEDWLITILN